MLQNTRQLPQRSTDSGGALDLAYSFDANANVNHIWDYAQDSGNGFYGRWMTYDGLDRLTDAGSCSFGGDCWHRFTYDALDNLKSWKLPGVKDYAEYVYTNNRLTNIKNTAGATVVGLDYDLQGNLFNKNGQAYGFDYGNRLRNVPDKESYRYDGLGRRVLNSRPADNTTTLSQYSQSGQVLYNENTKTLLKTEHIYLGGSLLANRETIWGTSTVTAKYQHTDALGSPVAVTNMAGAVIERTSYEPYGAAINKPAYDGIGYTGHVMDGATGLTYMQQRYMDPGIGRFLSVDPVTADSGTGANFNRYWYANNNPYSFTDPDGRVAGKIGKAIALTAAEMAAKKALKAAKNRAVRAAWKEERQLIASGRRGTRNWTESQKKELLERGKVDGFEGHHRNTANGNEDLAGNPDNIEFLSKPDHSDTHIDAGGTQEPISGQPLFDRTDNGSLPRQYDSNGYKIQALKITTSILVGVGTVADILDKLDPLTYAFYIDEVK
jgi:RHS repeat-associated protein